MKKLLIVVLALCGFGLQAQDFQKKFRTATPFALRNSKIQWVDADNDSLLDVMVVNTVQGEIKLAFYKNLGHDSFNLIKTIATGYQSGVFTLTDFDSDNKIDFVISGKNLAGTDGTEAFLNNGNFVFQKTASKIKNQSFSTLVFADLNNDGAKDLVAGDASSLYVFSQKNGQFLLEKDTAISIRSIKCFDFDGNGFSDIAYSGHESNGPTSGLLLFKDKFKTLRKVQLKRVEGILEAGDLNHDGFFDLIVFGKDSTGTSTIQTFKNNANRFSSIKRILNIDSVSARIADFTSDGKADIAFFQKSGSTYLSWIKTFAGDSVSIASANVKVQDYGDYDFDGDLDLVQLRSDSLIVLSNNLNATNRGPSVVAGAFAIQLYDRMFFYWRKSIDDHTDTTTVTYDLRVFSGNPAVISSEFDQANRHRLLVSHGNVGTNNFSIQHLQGNYFYQIQSIDNSFAIQTKFPTGTCGACVDVASDQVTICSPNTIVQLKPHAPKAMWFSFNKGFLGIHDSLSYSLSESDTIFSFNPAGNPSCSSIKLFPIIFQSTDTLKITKNIWNCENSQNTLKVASEWKSVNWKNNLNSTTATGNQITVTLLSPIVYQAFGTNSRGCKLKETFNLKISKPDLQVGNSQYQIAKGSNVQLSASGATSYSWSPPEGLSDIAIASPVASPPVTTQYIVMGKDSLGCSATTSVLVEVMEAGFVATLFTPNGDGKNDALKIFGLTSASNFRFTIFNREGNIMFDTQDIATASYQGWTGISNGQSQPSGTYYWKVEGDYGLGGQITLNGKKSGAFLLVR
ncbi:hypothetical protein WSM22_31160 [Cytophagales bacterium WSM2-2]|nr:hypothetical protein WSM22_31160 [Cytophagales bacterium WSM2-2]